MFKTPADLLILTEAKSPSWAATIDFYLTFTFRVDKRKLNKIQTAIF